MRLLLDTHIILTMIEKRSASFTPDIRRLIEDETAEHHVSVVSLWEIAIKWRLGKISITPGLDTLPELLLGMGLELIPILANHALANVDPEPLTRDPFDRMLLAQCHVENLRLVTLDRALVTHRLAARLK